MSPEPRRTFSGAVASTSGREPDDPCLVRIVYFAKCDTIFRLPLLQSQGRKAGEGTFRLIDRPQPSC